ncbi:MAG: phospholipase D-like domain-containing protein [Acetobacterium sp.]
MTNNMSMFDMNEITTGISKKEKLFEAKKLEVVKMNFVEQVKVTWEELFKGYDKLYSTTYSSSMKFLCDVLENFEYSEVIFGFEGVLNYTLEETIAFQDRFLERIRSTKNLSQEKLLTKIDDGNLKLYVSRSQMSHEKINLLESHDGRKRVILGSANLSYSAFNGKQRENICFIDGNQAFDYYYEQFEAFKENCSDNISSKAIAIGNYEDNLLDLPVMETIKVQKSMIIEPVDEHDEDIKFVFDVNELAKKIPPITPATSKSKKRTLITLDEMKKIQKKIKTVVEKERVQRKEFPKLVLDIGASKARLNEKELDLNPSMENVKKDADLFLKYMTGYEEFYGDSAELQERYYAFANWFFLTPFLATFKITAILNDKPKELYPMFGILCGQSKAGKTTFLQTLLTMMIGQKPMMSANEFKKSTINALKYEVMGVPIIIDDIVGKRFNEHAPEIIKDDEFGVAGNLLHYPAIVISANEDVKAVKTELIRRTVVSRVKGGRTNTDIMKSNIVPKIQKNIGTAFYREYLKRMMVVLPDHLDNLKKEDGISADLMEVSSKVLFGLFNDCECPPQHYIKILTIDDYFGDKITASNVIQIIQDAWAIDKKLFQIDKKANKLIYNALEVYVANRLVSELPEYLEAKQNGKNLVMDLKQSQSFFDRKFKKSLLFFE